MTHPSEQFEGTPLIAPSTIEHPLYEAVVEACRTVYDPEIPVNIYDLGLIYTIDIAADNAVKVIMTLTAPGCPVAGDMPGWIVEAIEPVAGVKEVDVELTWEPPWGMEMMSDEAPSGTGLYVEPRHFIPANCHETLVFSSRIRAAPVTILTDNTCGWH